MIIKECFLIQCLTALNLIIFSVEWYATLVTLFMRAYWKLHFLCQDLVPALIVKKFSKRHLNTHCFLVEQVLVHQWISFFFWTFLFLPFDFSCLDFVMTVLLGLSQTKQLMSNDVFFHLETHHQFKLITKRCRWRQDRRLQVSDLWNVYFYFWVGFKYLPKLVSLVHSL